MRMLEKKLFQVCNLRLTLQENRRVSSWALKPPDHPEKQKPCRWVAPSWTLPETPCLQIRYHSVHVRTRTLSRNEHASFRGSPSAGPGHLINHLTITHCILNTHLFSTVALVRPLEIVLLLYCGDGSHGLSEAYVVASSWTNQNECIYGSCKC